VTQCGRKDFRKLWKGSVEIAEGMWDVGYAEERIIRVAREESN